MLERVFGGSFFSQGWLGLLILVVSVALAWLSHFYMARAARRLAQRTGTKLGDSMVSSLVSSLDKPLSIIIILLGLYLATRALPLEPGFLSGLSRGLLIVLSLLGIYAAASLLGVVIRWYESEVAAKKTAGMAGRLLHIFWAVILLTSGVAGILVVLNIMGVALTPVTDWIGVHGWRIALIIVLAMATIILLSRFTSRVIAATMSRQAGEPEDEVKKRADTLSRVLVNVGQVAVIFVTVFMVLSELDIDITPILAGLGVAGIAIGFGAQSLIKDFLAGLFIILESQYRVGDVVKIADVGGLVEDINLRRTVLRDLDGIVHVVPNGEIRVASNYTRGWSRVNLNVSVAYGEDLDRVITVINRVGKELAEDPQWAPFILKAPQVLRVDELGASGIDIKILGDTKPIRQWDVAGELRKRLKKVFDEEGIEIPWPHTKVYFGNMPPFPEGRGPGGKAHS